MLFNACWCLLALVCSNEHRCLSKMAPDALNGKMVFDGKMWICTVKINVNIRFWWNPHNKRIIIRSFSTNGLGLRGHLRSFFFKTNWNSKNPAVQKQNMQNPNCQFLIFWGLWGMSYMWIDPSRRGVMSRRDAGAPEGQIKRKCWKKTSKIVEN